MAVSTIKINRDKLVVFATEYADQSADEGESLVIPEDLAELSDEDLQELSVAAVEAFDSVYGDGATADFSDDDLATLSTLTEGIERINAESAERAERASERAAQAEELASRVRPADAEADTEEEVEEDGEDGVGDGEDAEAEAGEEGEAEASAVVEEEAALVASGRGDIRVPLRNIRARSRARQALPRNDEAPSRMEDVVLAADVPGFRQGQGLDWIGLGKAVDRRLGGFNPSQYSNANARQMHLREQHSVASIHRNIPEEFTVQNSDPAHISEILDRVTDQSRLPKGSLVASGGWCAPSEVTYDFLELETADGIVSVPEIGINRGGIRWTTGPKFSDIYSSTGFSYTEQEDIDGDYDGEGGGEKPCYKVDCPDFEEARLQVDGLCISAGLLQQRGYPEVIARTVRGALVAHRHKMAEKRINAMTAGSTAVTMPADQVGTTAPVLTAIELQVQHYRYVHRLGMNAVLEAVFPAWVHGAIRSDLSRRLGVDLIDVNDARISAWFRARGVNAQFVYNYQDITGDADAFTAWPSTVKFLLYAAGTWVFGTSDVITLDTIYDSVKLAHNDFTALFTEEGWLAMKRFEDSREVTVNICPSGATAGGVLIDCDGSAGSEG